MDVTDVFRIAAAVIASVGGASVIVAGASAWLGKVWADRLMRQDIAKHNEVLSSLNSNLKKLEAEHQVRFSRLHEKQAEVMATLYDRLYHFNVSIQRLQFEYRHREIREDLDRKFYLNKREEWELVPGIHTLRSEESEWVNELSKITSELHLFYGTNRLYLPKKCCALMDRFSSISAFVASSYQNVALKDNDGNLLVHLDVKKLWDAALETIPALLSELEEEFRSTLGAEK